MKITVDGFNMNNVNLRKSKKNWMEGTLGAALSLQFQQQQQAKMRQPEAKTECDEALDKTTLLILSVLGEHATDEELPLLLRVYEGLEVQKIHLKALESLFHYPPYPRLKTLVGVLEGDAKDVTTFINEFDKDPKAGRASKVNKYGHLIKETEELLAEQFDTSQVAQVIAEIKYIIEETPLTSQEQYELAQQIIYINAVGMDHPLVINDAGSIKKYEHVTQLSRSDLRQLSDSLITIVRRSDISDLDKLKAQLNLLAVVREHYFRVTGRFANTTQLITVLMSLKNQRHNMLMDINIGEGDSSTTALLAVMQWVHADGGSVDVCMANRGLVVDAYEDKGNNDFFTSLGIKSSHIEASSQKNTYQLGGVNYSTLGDLALYRERAKLENELLTPEKEDLPLSFHLVIDASDLSTLEDRTLFNFAVSSEGVVEGTPNLYSWIYPLVNKFINLKEFKNIDPLTCWGEDEDIRQLKEFLYENAPTGLYKAQLNTLPDSTFNIWINSAIAAERLVEGEDFHIAQSTTEAHVAVPYNLKIPQRGATFSRGIQQFLHARLQSEYESNGWTFSIDPEMLIVSSVSARDLINEYKKHGRILAISGTLGAKEELVTLQDKFNMDVACRIPPHTALKRESLVSQVTQNKKDRMAVLDEAVLLQKRQNEAAAVARYYMHTVSGIQEVVMKQFDEWQAFLQIFVSKQELRQLNNDLLHQREDLMRTLGEQWQVCLNNSDPDKKYLNPYERRKRTGELVTADLDKALQAFEAAANTVWEKQRIALKAKTEGKIKEGSVDALRCDYMTNISLSEQVHLSVLKKHTDKKEAHQEKKKAHRYLASGLDVNGAMLEYSDGNLDAYRKSFVLSQVELFKNEMIQLIENNVFLSKLARINLVLEIRRALNLDALLTILNAYPGTLPEAQLDQKYSMQPIIQQLLYLYQKADLQETEALSQLRSIYLDKVVVELVDNLEHTLSWAAVGNQGFGYWLERTAVTKAACELLKSIEGLKAATKTTERQLAIKDLYKVLILHQAELEDVWIFSFGHKNTRTLIKETLATLDGLTTIGSDEHAIGAAFIHECKEEAVNLVMQKKLTTALDVLECRTKTLATDPEWGKFKSSLSLIQSNCGNIYAFDEMNYFLAKKIEELGKTHSKLLAPAIQLRGELRKIWDELEEKHQDIMDKSTYFMLKAEQFRGKLAAVGDCTIKEVTLKASHNGFSDYLDLIIKAQGFHPLLASFTQYNAQVSGLVKMHGEVDEELKQHSPWVLGLEQLIREQLPLLRSTSVGTLVNLVQFPEDVHPQVKTILKLRAYALDEQFPEDLSAFEEAVQYDFHDRLLLQSLDLTHLDLAKIDEVSNPQIKEELFVLHGKLNPPAKAPVSFLGGLWNFALGLITYQESVDDLHYQFEVLKSSISARLKATLASDIDTKQEALSTKLEGVYQKALSLEKTLIEKNVFLRDRISEETAKGGVYCKRFKDTAELYDFEKQMHAFKESTAEKDVHNSNSLGDGVHLEDEVPECPNPN